MTRPLAMQNPCTFSPDRRHRYSLDHLLPEPAPEPRRASLVMWIGLNPSTADENQLDPTLRRIAAFSRREGFGGFVMTNLFAFRATRPADMMAARDPVGPDNDRILARTARRCELVVAAWGAHGDFENRAERVRRLLRGARVVHLGCTQGGHPRHPLYVRGTTPLTPYDPPVEP